MIQRISSLFSGGGQIALRGIDLAVSSRLTWLVTGILTTGVLGRARADRLQDLRLEKAHNPAQCETRKCNHEELDSDFREICIKQDSCKRDHFNVHSEKANHTHRYHWVRHRPEWRRESTLSWSQWFVGIETFSIAAYGVALFFQGIGGGRLPATGKVLNYVITQMGVKFLDVMVLARLVMGHTEHREKKDHLLRGFTKGFIDGSVWGWERRSAPELAVAAAYFGFRLVDGWFMAGMPANTAPMMSLFAKLKPLLSGILHRS